MSVKAVRLRNFRGFADAEIELKPLTVLLGPNSAGKSSFGQALAAMAHCQWLQGNSEQATLTPGNDVDQWPVDLGTWDDLRNAKSKDLVYIGLKTAEGWVDMGFGPGHASDMSRDLLFSYAAYPTRKQSSGSGVVAAHETPSVEASTSGSIPSGVTEVRTGDQSRIVLRRESEKGWINETENVAIRAGLAGLIVETVQPVLGGTPAVLNKPARDEIREALEGLTYLRAVRRRPSRLYEVQKARRRQSIGYEGEFAISILSEFGSKEVVEYVELPPSPRSLAEAKLQISGSWSRKSSSLEVGVTEWLNAMGLAHSFETGRSQRGEDLLQLRVAPQGHNLHDSTEVGFGISQVLPVISGGLLQRMDSIFIVDLPEAHLHPRPQAALADFFCSLALSGRQSLVETHSEMFFHRLRLRVEMHPELNDMISVYFIDQPKDNECSRPRLVGLTQDKELQWPVGFFQEGWDTETQINAVRQARRGVASGV